MRDTSERVDIIIDHNVTTLESHIDETNGRILVFTGNANERALAPRQVDIQQNDMIDYPLYDIGGKIEGRVGDGIGHHDFPFSILTIFLSVGKDVTGCWHIPILSFVTTGLIHFVSWVHSLDDLRDHYPLAQPTEMLPLHYTPEDEWFASLLQKRQA